MRLLVSVSRTQVLRQAAGKRSLPLKMQAPAPASTQPTACLSTHSALRKAKGPQDTGDNKGPETSQSQNPELPAFSLSALGLSKNMRIGLIVILSIFGTIETWFYCQAIWRWWKGKQAEKATGPEAN